MAVAGSSQMAPFADNIADPSSGIKKGFLAYIDQLAKPLWIYYLDVDTAEVGDA